MSVGIHTSKGFVKVAGVGMGASPMSGATENKDGAAGLVPAPSIADRNKFLKGNGLWEEIDQVNTEEILTLVFGQSEEFDERERISKSVTKFTE